MKQNKIYDILKMMIQFKKNNEIDKNIIKLLLTVTYIREYCVLALKMQRKCGLTTNCIKVCKEEFDSTLFVCWNRKVEKIYNIKNKSPKIKFTNKDVLFYDENQYDCIVIDNASYTNKTFMDELYHSDILTTKTTLILLG